MRSTRAVASDGPSHDQHTQDHDGQDEHGEDGEEHVDTLGRVTALRKSVAMTTLLDTPVPSVVDALRGERHRRPMADHHASSGLRAVLEDGIYELLAGRQLATSTIVHSSSLRDSWSVPELASSSVARLRGVLLMVLLRLLSVGVQVDAPFDDALCAWRSQSGGGQLDDAFDRLEPDELARLSTEVQAHWTTLRRALGVIPAIWQPRTGMHVSQRLAGGDVVLVDNIDLMFGSTNSRAASVTLLDVTSSPLAEGAERAMRYHALVQTLRSGVVPLRTSVFSSATGELWIGDVDPQLLMRSVRDVLEALERDWSAR